MQQITITGYLSKDAEHGSTQNGNPWARWNVPVRQGWGDSERTNWYRVTVWGKRADYASKARKGEFVTVTGELTIGEYNDKPQYEINASDFQSVRTAPREGGQGAPAGGSQGGGANAGTYEDDLDDSIPFITSEGIL